MADFAEKLTAFMEKTGESQSSLSRKSGVPQTIISAYLRRLNQPSWANVQLIAKALGVSCRDLEDDELKLTAESASPAEPPPKPKRGRPKKNNAEKGGK